MTSVGSLCRKPWAVQLRSPLPRTPQWDPGNPGLSNSDPLCPSMRSLCRRPWAVQIRPLCPEPLVQLRPPVPRTPRPTQTPCAQNPSSNLDPTCPEPLSGFPVQETLSCPTMSPARTQGSLLALLKGAVLTHWSLSATLFHSISSHTENIGFSFALKKIKIKIKIKL